jgi:pyruvate/2-oxoglutarate dehydrogenase complex dihydrolipoamide dehydrogenase (E3) component
MAAARQQEGGEVAAPEEARTKFREPAATNYDVIVIGAGSAGLSAASIANTLGARVALLERDRFGGECLFTGCIASKALLRVARAAQQIRTAAELGLAAGLAPVDLGAVADFVQRAVMAVYTESDAPELFARRGVDVVIGTARFVSPTALTINDQQLSARRFLICTGSHPVVPPIPGLAEAGFLTNETIFSARTLPARLLVIGGGPMGCELGQAFARLGSRVTLVQRAERLLPRDEPAASAVLAARLRAEGVTIHTRAEVRQIAPQEGAKSAVVASADGSIEIEADEILIAVGRAPTVDALQLAAAGVATTEQGITTDETLRTSNPRIYAVGDVIGGYRYTHAAVRQARIAVRNMLYPGSQKVDEHVTPWTTFTEPEVARVGLSEAEARARHGAGVRVYTQPMRGVDRAVTEDETEGFVQLVSDGSGKLYGATVVGPSAGEFINVLALAMEHNIGLSQLARVVHVYPTVALSIQQAAGQYSAERAAGNRLFRLLRRRGQRG